VNQEHLDDLARAAARADDLSFSRRTAVKLAIVAAVLAAPFGARINRAWGAIVP